MKQKELSNTLIVICCAIAVGLLAACIVGLPNLGKTIVSENPTLSYMELPCLIYIWIAALPVFAALYIAVKICLRIGEDNSFCNDNAVGLKNIGRIFFAESIYFFIGAIAMAVMQILYLTVFIVFALAVIISLAASVAAFVMSHLTYKAYLLKRDSELTI